MDSSTVIKKDVPENVKRYLAKMVSDKNDMRAYIKSNGTLQGFKGNNVRFAKPL